METLKAARELPFFGISPYYFLLHISVDNADSGHTAMAASTVMEYMSLIEKKEGQEAAKEVWQRIQSGYMLSKDGDGPTQASYRKYKEPVRTLADHEARVMNIFKQKANVSTQLHCKSRVKIGRQTLEAWLSASLSNDDSSRLLDSLAGASPWIRKGNSSNSLLIQYLSPGGKMFGAFTHTEVEALRSWVDGLQPSPQPAEQIYLSAIRRRTMSFPRAEDPAADYPVFSLTPNVPTSTAGVAAFAPRSPLRSGTTELSTILPLWFGHLSLLEGFVSTPYRTSTRLNSHVVRLLRAEYGFLPETTGIAGIDEYLHNNYSPSLVHLGIEMALRQNISKPCSLQDVLGVLNEHNTDAQVFARSLVAWAMYPKRNEGLLLGLSRLFLDFELWIAATDTFLDGSERLALQDTVQRKEKCFELCLQELLEANTKYQDFCWGYAFGRKEIERLLNHTPQEEKSTQFG